MTQRIDFQTHPGRYRHWKLSIDGPVATLAMDVAEDGGLVPGYELKLNSYDLGVDIELYDAVQRLRFEHPEVGADASVLHPRSDSQGNSVIADQTGGADPISPAENSAIRISVCAPHGANMQTAAAASLKASTTAAITRVRNNPQTISVRTRRI